jgi:hypothetical protein
MLMMRVIRSGLPLLAATLMVASLAPAAQAAPVSRYEAGVQLDGKPLVLNGAGTRYRVVLKVYDLGLYLPRKAASAEEALAMPGPKKLHFVALRELPGTDLGVAFIKGLSENSPKEQVQKHSVSTTRLIEIFSGKTRMMPGETFAMDYVPGKGTTFVIAGQPQGAPVGDAEFFNMVLRIWLGNSPVDRLLKDSLLGAERPAP